MASRADDTVCTLFTLKRLSLIYGGIVFLVCVSTMNCQNITADLHGAKEAVKCYLARFAMVLIRKIRLCFLQSH